MTTSPYDDHWDNIYHHILRKFYMNSFFRSLTGNCLLGVIFAIMIGNGASADMNMENGRKCLGNYISDRGATLTVEKIESDLFKFSCSEPKNAQWETIALYSNVGNYFKGVFRYKTLKDVYKDNLGFHLFKVMETDGRISILKSGGWDNDKDFGTELFKPTKK